jgi:hypothetical protein
MLPSASPSGSSLFLPSFCWQAFVFFVITCHNHYPVFVAAGKDSDGFPHVSPTGCSNWAPRYGGFFCGQRRRHEIKTYLRSGAVSLKQSIPITHSITGQVDWLRFTWRWSNTRNQLPL